MHVGSHLPFLYIFLTLIAGKIWEDEAAFILSAKWLFTLELFSDLHLIVANQYLRWVDSDHVLSRGIDDLAHPTAEKLIQPTLPTPNADKIFNNLHLDKNNNVLVTLEDPLRSQTIHTLNEKLTQHYTLQNIKDNLHETQNCVLDKFHDDTDQNGED